MGVQAVQLSLLLQTLGSVLLHRDTALGVHQEAGWLTLQPQALSCREALCLLQCYGSITHDQALLTQVQSVAEKQQIKELQGLAKDKGRGKFLSSQARGQAEDCVAEVEEQEQTSLAGCKPHLRSIFTHWEPVSPIAGAQTSQPPQQSFGQEDCLSSATAHLLIKWSLRSLVEETYDENRTLDFLQWFQKVAIPHKGIVDILVHDPAVKANLLRLYHKAFESQLPSQSSRVETLQLFTSIMTHLLEVQGCPSGELHQAVLTACLTESTHDLSRKEAGLQLLSLYLHEMWTGAESPALFLVHVRLVTEANGKGPAKSKHLRTKVPVRDICSDIVQSMELKFP